MSREFKIPELGENVESASVARILVSEGDRIEKDQNVVELETDKAAAEVPCDRAGTVEKIHVQEGDDVKVGQVLLTLSEDGEEKKQNEQPDRGRQDGEREEEAEDAGGKAPREPSPEQKPDRPQAEEREQEKEATRGQEESEAGKEAPAPEPEEQPEPEEEEPVPAAPSVRRFAREIGVDIGAVRGSGPNGRISVDDVKTHARHARAPAAAGGGAAPDLPDFSRWGSVRREPMRKVRRLTAERMSQAWSTVPHATQFGAAELAGIETLRRRYAAEAETAGGHLSVTAVVVKTMAAALKAFPRFNASVDARKNEIVYKDYVNIGVAMDTPRGLLVPVVRNADALGLIELSVRLRTLIDKARQGALSVEDMQGGNATVTNAGALGGDTFIPIVNWPEAAILGVAQSRTEAVFQGGEFRPRELLPLALSYDHRLIDGADGVRFLKWLVSALEDPLRLVVGSAPTGEET